MPRIAWDLNRFVDVGGLNALAGYLYQAGNLTADIGEVRQIISRTSGMYPGVNQISQVMGLTRQAIEAAKDFANGGTAWRDIAPIIDRVAFQNIDGGRSGRYNLQMVIKASKTNRTFQDVFMQFSTEGLTFDELTELCRTFWNELGHETVGLSGDTDIAAICNENILPFLATRTR